MRLASKLSGWNLDIVTEAELEQRRNEAAAELKQIPSMTEELVDVLLEAGFSSLEILGTAEEDELTEIDGVSPELARELIAGAQAALESQTNQPEEEEAN